MCGISCDRLVDSQFIRPGPGYDHADVSGNRAPVDRYVRVHIRRVIQRIDAGRRVGILDRYDVVSTEVSIAIHIAGGNEMLEERRNEYLRIEEVNLFRGSTEQRHGYGVDGRTEIAERIGFHHDIIPRRQVCECISSSDRRNPGIDEVRITAYHAIERDRDTGYTVSVFRIKIPIGVHIDQYRTDDIARLCIPEVSHRGLVGKHYGTDEVIRTTIRVGRAEISRQIRFDNAVCTGSYTGE